MPLFVWVDASPRSCHDAATTLRALADATETIGDRYAASSIASESEWSEGIAGQRFRESADGVKASAGDVVEQIRSFADTLDAFADDITTVMTRMNAAVDVAVGAGLDVKFKGSYPEWIFDPPPLIDRSDGFVGPVVPTEADRDRVERRTAAFGEALEIVREARIVEGRAHGKLRQATVDNDSLLVRIGNNLKANSPWMAGSFVTGVVGEALDRSNKWAVVAETRATQVDLYRAQATTALSDATRQSALTSWVKLSGMEEAALANAKANATLAVVNPNGKLARGLTKNLGPWVGDTAGPIARKLPVVGGAVALGQTGYEIRVEAEDLGDVAAIGARNLGGYVVGGVATALLVGLGAPVLVTVAGGVLVGWGVSNGIDKVLG